MKIAVISDVHGNLEALAAVLLDIENEKCDKVFCLGDLALGGPEPVEAIQKFKELSAGNKFELIQGNTDEMLCSFSQERYEATAKLNQVMANAYKADYDLLSQDDKEFLCSLEKSHELEINGLKILFVHGSPRRNDENIFGNLPISEVEAMIKGVSANIVFCGHTHIPCGYQTNSNQTVVNVGSVGRPFSEEPKSCYSIINVFGSGAAFQIKHKFIEYDYKTAVEKLKNRGFEGADKLAKMLESATSRYPQ